MLILLVRILKNIENYKSSLSQIYVKKMDLLGVTMYIADIYEIENNKRLVKNFEIKAFCYALNVSLEDLYDDTDKYFEH